MMAPHKVWLITAVGPPPWAITIDDIGPPGHCSWAHEGDARMKKRNTDKTTTGQGTSHGPRRSGITTTSQEPTRIFSTGPSFRKGRPGLPADARQRNHAGR